MLKIRLQRVGRIHEPAFRVVLTDSRNSTKSGRYLEVLGNYDPRGGREGALKKDRIAELVSKGAQPTATVHNLLIKKGIIKGAKIDVSAKKKLKKGETEAGVATPSVSAEKKVEEKTIEPKSETAKDEVKKEEQVKEEKKEEPAAPETKA